MEYQEKKCIYQVMYFWVMFARRSTHIILMSPPFLSLSVPSVVPSVCPSSLRQLSLPPSLCLPFTVFLSLFSSLPPSIPLSLLPPLSLSLSFYLSFPTSSSLSYSPSLPLFLHSFPPPSLLLSLSLPSFSHVNNVCAILA